MKTIQPRSLAINIGLVFVNNPQPGMGLLGYFSKFINCVARPYRSVYILVLTLEEWSKVSKRIYERNNRYTVYKNPSR